MRRLHGRNGCLRQKADTAEIQDRLTGALIAIGMDDWGTEELLPIVLEVSEVNFAAISERRDWGATVISWVVFSVCGDALTLICMAVLKAKKQSVPR